MGIIAAIGGAEGWAFEWMVLRWLDMVRARVVFPVIV